MRSSIAGSVGKEKLPHPSYGKGPAMPDLNCIESALSRTGWNRARASARARVCQISGTVRRVAVSRLTAQTVCLTRLAVLFPSEASTDSCYKRMQRFLRGFDLNYGTLARLLAQIAGVPTPWTLALDRTNWKLGKAELNVLMLCVVHQGVAFPLLWAGLAKDDGRGKAGNSNTDERIVLMERFLQTFGGHQVGFLCADREFVSREWLRWLLENGISFRLRLKSDVLVTNGHGEQVCADWLFRNCPIQRELNLGQRLVLGHRLFVSGTRLADGDFLIVISDKAFSLSDYALRWGIETLFAAFKSRGFRLEDTHVTCPERLSRLIGLLAIAYCWAFAAGKWLEEVKPLKLKKHGRAPISLVRRGLDYLRPVALQLCATVSKCDVKQATGFLSCT